MANIFSILRIILIPVIIWLFIADYNTASFVLFLAAAFTDLLDGFIARRFHKETKIGEFLDPLADKLLIIGVFAAFIIKQAVTLFVLLIFIRELCVFIKNPSIFLRQKIKRTGSGSLFLWKVTTFLYSLTACAIFLGFNPKYLIIVTSIFSLFAGLDYLIGKQLIKFIKF